MDVPFGGWDTVPDSGKAFDILAVFPDNQGNLPSSAVWIRFCVNETSTDFLHVYSISNFMKHCQIVVKMWVSQNFCIEHCRFKKSKIFDNTGSSLAHCTDLLVSVYKVQDVCCSHFYCSQDANFIISLVTSVYHDSQSIFLQTSLGMSLGLLLMFAITTGLNCRAHSTLMLEYALMCRQ